MTGATVLIVDDEATIRRLLSVVVTRAGYRSIEAPSGSSALHLLATARPDAMLIDLGLPDRDGLELIASVRTADPRIALIVVSARDATAEKVAALDLGADDYVTKPFDGDELLARLRAALRRNASPPAEAVVCSGSVEIDLVTRMVRRAGSEIRLPPKEYALLAELARHAGRVLTHRHLLEAVWGKAHGEDVEYLRVAARALRLKLEDDPARPALIRNEPGIGYRLMLLPA
jgi:two-component system KDP operon response regulator KdpE